MKYYLVQFSDNYADEFDVSGFDVWTENQFIEFYEKLGQLIAKEPEVNYNDYSDYSEYYKAIVLEFNYWKEYINCFSYKEIYEEEYNTIRKFFPYAYGIFPSDMIYEENEKDETL